MIDADEKTLDLGGGPPEQRLVITVKTDPKKRWVCVHMKGRVDVFTYLELSKRLNELFDDGQGVSLILDLGGVVYVASSGWSVMLATRTRLKRNQGRLVLSGMSEDLARIYKTMKLTDLIPSYATVAEAEKALAAV